MAHIAESESYPVKQLDVQTGLVFRSPVAATGKNQKKTRLQLVFLQPAVAIFTFRNKKTKKTKKNRF